MVWPCPKLNGIYTLPATNDFFFHLSLSHHYPELELSCAQFPMDPPSQPVAAIATADIATADLSRGERYDMIFLLLLCYITLLTAPVVV